MYVITTEPMERTEYVTPLHQQPTTLHNTYVHVK